MNHVRYLQTKSPSELLQCNVIGKLISVATYITFTGLKHVTEVPFPLAVDEGKEFAVLWIQSTE